MGSMQDETPSPIRHREIQFRAPHPDPNQAQSATLVLGNIDGIHQVEPQDTLRLLISYDIRRINLQLIEDVLEDLGFHLDNSLLNKLKRAFYYYSEEIAREQFDGKPCQDDTQALFIQKYRQRPHGCRDERPEHWRHYL